MGRRYGGYRRGPPPAQTDLALQSSTSRCSRNQLVAWSLPIVEPPLAAHLGGQFAAGQRRHRLRRHQPALRRIGGDRHVERHIFAPPDSMCSTRSCAIPVANTNGAPCGGQHQVRLHRTKAVIRVHRMQRLRPRLPDRRQRHHHHRLRIHKRGRHIQAQIQAVACRQRQRRNVLEVRRVQRTQYLYRIHNRARRTGYTRRLRPSSSS